MSIQSARISQTGLPPVLMEEGVAKTLIDLASAAMQRSPDISELLIGEIDRARIVPNGCRPDDVVTIGSRVRFRDSVSNRETEVELVWPQYADIVLGRISILTAVGAALIGLRKGASISYTTLRGDERTILVQDVA